MKITKYIPIALGATLLVFFSCKKQIQQPDSEFQSSLDHSLANAEFSSIDNMVDVEAGRDSLITGKTTSYGIFCPGSVITVTAVIGTINEMVIDFGTGCTCSDGRLRTGKLTATFVGKWLTPGTFVDIEPTDYTVNGNSLLFEKRITYNGINTDGHKNWTTTVTGGQVITSTGTIEWETSRETEWISGDGDTDPSNNVYSITATSSGKSRRGITFTAATETPLIVHLNCPNIVQGIVSITPTGYQERSIDYGTGSCDNQATLTIGEWSTVITLY